jgi:hypothetical protein
VRVRVFELRLIAIALVASWTLSAALVLLSYRPGGPIDLLVGLSSAGPIAVAVAGVIWPPLAHGRRSFPAMMWLGIAGLLFLLPAIGGFVNQIRALGSQTLLPSFEATYPWLLALGATSLFTGFGVARRMLGQTAMRRARLIRGVLVAAVMAVAAAGIFGGSAVANDLAMRDRVTAASRFGPTDPETEPGLCDGPLAVGRTAQLLLTMNGEIDLRPIGSFDLAGTRSGRDYRWLAYVATDRELGTYGRASVGGGNWARTPSRDWHRVDAPDAAAFSLDRHILETALTEGFRATAEDYGIEIVGGARARRCRIAVDGETFAAAFPQVRWLVGDADVHRWRGQLDYWIFLDGQLGQVAGSVNGEAGGIEQEALLATVELRLTATERDRDAVVYPPAR